MIGRQKEQEELARLYDSNESEFVAVYGRRRVGKTYLIREVFDGRMAFVHTGKANGSTSVQLAHFQQSLKDYGAGRIARPKTWDDAFAELRNILLRNKSRRKVVFIDEMPWLDTPRSNFLSALDSFWNEWASARKDILLIICGSAAAWMVKNLFRNHGGLHNRVTARIALQPFSLGECEEYAEDRGLAMSRGDLAECYMILGGIPYYWRALQRGLGLPQNIDRLLFEEGAPLRGEFNELYKSLFRNGKTYEKVVAALARKKAGMTRAEIIEACGESLKGMLSEILSSLEYCGFVRCYRMIGKRKREALYQLIDNFTLFHFRFLDGATNDPNFWRATALSPTRAAWRGLAFERLCLLHVQQIKAALGIAGIHVESYSWSHTKDELVPKGAQIDLLLDRSDGIINVCEMKFAADQYVIDAQAEEDLRRKLATFQAVTGTRKALHLTMVTSFGLLKNSHCSRVQSEVTLDDLFGGK